MAIPETDDLEGRLDAVVDEARGQAKAFQEQAEAERLGVEDRFRKFLPIADRIVEIARGKIECLQQRLKFDVTPSLAQSGHFYSKGITLDIKTEMAGVLRIGFRLSHDSGVRNILLDYTLEIVPVYLRFNPHSRLELPLEGFQEAAVSKWFDDCLVEFARTYVELLSTKQYQERVLVSDPVAGISFPKYYAAATLEHEGQTHHFVSDESRREFARRNGLGA